MPGGGSSKVESQPGPSDSVRVQPTLDGQSRASRHDDCGNVRQSFVSSSPCGFDAVLTWVHWGSGALREGPKIRPFVRMPHDHSHRPRSNYRNRRFKSEIIELCVRWYLTYRLSYRDLVEMMAERGVTISHSTILRWVQRYVPEFERRWGRFARRVHSSWRMDETAVSVRGGAHYLYRAVDKHGKTVDSLLCADRSESAARAFSARPLRLISISGPVR